MSKSRLRIEPARDGFKTRPLQRQETVFHVVLLKEFGTLAKGKAADLLVLEKNPLDNIANMRTIQANYLGGKKFE